MKKKGAKKSQRGRMKKNKGVKESQRERMENQVASTSTGKLDPPPPPPWRELPENVTAKILHKLGAVGLLQTAQYACTTWRKICRDPTMWRVIDMWKLGDVGDKLRNEDKEVLCRLAVDLSQGQVTEINIEDFLTFNLLEYIAQRCGNLRCLRLASCGSGKTLSKVIKGFPLLEVLHLQCTPVRKWDIEAIGQSCPMLKTFCLNGRGCIGRGLKSSEEAIGIANFMPELLHLQLFANGMTNEVLETILNGCPKLETLDLRQCFNLNLEGELGERYAQQLKILLRPHDPTDDYEWDATGFDWITYLYDGSDLDSDYDYNYDDSSD